MVLQWNAFATGHVFFTCNAKLSIRCGMRATHTHTHTHRERERASKRVENLFKLSDKQSSLQRALREASNVYARVHRLYQINCTEALPMRGCEWVVGYLCIHVFPNIIKKYENSRRVSACVKNQGSVWKNEFEMRAKTQRASVNSASTILLGAGECKLNV